MYNEKIEALIKAALADGVLTEKEKQILFKRAQSEGIDLDEFEMVLDARLYELQKDGEKSVSAPESDKFGDVRKCPACGAIVVSGMAVCNECGYAFSNIDANRTYQRLFDELTQIEKRATLKNSDVKGILTSFASMYLGQGTGLTKEKMTLISNYVIPNTRADLIDMLTSIQGKVDSKAPKDGTKSDHLTEDLGYAYWQLYTNCINKAKVSFADDKSFSPYFDFYEEELKRSKKKFGLF